MFGMFDYEIYKIINICGFLIGIAFGAIAQKNQFCFSGCIKDYILIGSTKRASSVVMAIISAIIFTQLITSFYNINLYDSRYFNNINYFAIALGGGLFGVGMMLADGCSNRHLIKFAQGNSNSLVSLLFIAIFAYASTKGFLASWVLFIVQNETLLKISSYINNNWLNVYVVLFVLFVYLLFLTKSIKRILYLKDGIFIGLLVAIAWSITGVLGNDSIDRYIPIGGISFVYPSASALELFTHYETKELSFGISVVVGVVVGAFLMSKNNKKYSFGCTSNVKSETKNNIIGAILMGIGGVMSIGCTVGQGLSGVSTLAFSSFIAILSIVFFAYITALYMNKNKSLPMCFIFDWDDNAKKKDDKLLYDI